MRTRVAGAVVRALEDAGARFAFGIPGVHNLDLYDTLQTSSVLPVLVTDEQSASFMADAVSRSSDSIGVVNTVPGPGITHALSGIAEAFMDNVPLVVLTAGVRRDTGKAYQLHDIDQRALLRPITKAVLTPERGEDVYAAVRTAFDRAAAGTPGPVAVEIPADFYLLTQEGEEQAYEAPKAEQPTPDAEAVEQAAQRLNAATQPLIYVGNGARGAAPWLVPLANLLLSPVATTIHGKGVFPEDHPYWLWNGLGASAPWFVRDVANACDVMLAIGCRFSEVATGSYGMEAPPSLIHVDINSEVFNRNYPASLAIQSDAASFVTALLPRLNQRADAGHVLAHVVDGHQQLRAERDQRRSERGVTPSAFFAALQQLAPRAIYTLDSGNGLFLAMEHLRLSEPGCFLAPVDYSSMGYCVPAAIGAKLANTDRDVIALAGDGALLMTGLELLTATHYGVAPLVFVLRDGELGQIAQLQRTAFAEAEATLLPPYGVESFAAAVGGEFLRMDTDEHVERLLARALEQARNGRLVLVELAIDYSRQTFFTRGIIRTNFWRLPLSDRARVMARAVSRRLRRPPDEL